MVGDNLCGGLAPFICKLCSKQMIVVRLSALATLLLEKKRWFSLSWMQSGHWRWPGCFGENIVLLLLPNFDPQIFQCIFYS